MATIWKFPISIVDEQEVPMPVGARMLHAGLDPRGQACVWAEVEPGNPKIDRTICVRGTGNPLIGHETKHLGTFVMAPFVWHVYNSRDG